jgi:hypothetical protein
VQRCSFKLGNELVNVFPNASIATTVKTFEIVVLILATNSCEEPVNALSKVVGLLQAFWCNTC